MSTFIRTQLLRIHEIQKIKHSHIFTSVQLNPDLLALPTKACKLTTLNRSYVQEVRRIHKVTYLAYLNETKKSHYLLVFGDIKALSLHLCMGHFVGNIELVTCFCRMFVFAGGFQRLREAFFNIT